VIQVPGTKVPVVPPSNLEAMGYKFHVYYPLFGHAARALRDFVRGLKQALEDRTKVPSMEGGLGPMEIEEIMGLATDSELQRKYRI
jgi:hypothetical protein